MSLGVMAGKRMGVCMLWCFGAWVLYEGCCMWAGGPCACLEGGLLVLEGGLARQHGGAPVNRSGHQVYGVGPEVER